MIFKIAIGNGLCISPLSFLYFLVYLEKFSLRILGIYSNILNI